MIAKPTIYVSLTCKEGNGMFQLDLSSFTPAERQFMVRLFEGAKSGVEFGVEGADDGRDIMRFTLGAALKAA